MLSWKNLAFARTFNSHILIHMVLFVSSLKLVSEFHVSGFQTDWRAFDIQTWL